MERNAAAIRATGIPDFEPVAAALDQIVAELGHLAGDPEKLEQRLSVLGAEADSPGTKPPDRRTGAGEFVSDSIRNLAPTRAR